MPWAFGADMGIHPLDKVIQFALKTLPGLNLLLWQLLVNHLNHSLQVGSDSAFCCGDTPFLYGADNPLMFFCNPLLAMQHLHAQATDFLNQPIVGVDEGGKQAVPRQQGQTVMKVVILGGRRGGPSCSALFRPEPGKPFPDRLSQMGVGAWQPCTVTHRGRWPHGAVWLQGFEEGLLYLLK